MPLLNKFATHILGSTWSLPVSLRCSASVYLMAQPCPVLCQLWPFALCSEGLRSSKALVMASQFCSAPAVWHHYHTKASCPMRSVTAPNQEPFRLPCSSRNIPFICSEPQQVHDILSPLHCHLFLSFSIDSPDPTHILKMPSTAARDSNVSLSRLAATELARPLIHFFSCCCLQEPLCFLFNISSYSLSQLPVLRHIP